MSTSLQLVGILIVIKKQFSQISRCGRCSKRIFVCLIFEAYNPQSFSFIVARECMRSKTQSNTQVVVDASGAVGKE